MLCLGNDSCWKLVHYNFYSLRNSFKNCLECWPSSDLKLAAVCNYSRISSISIQAITSWILASGRMLITAVISSLREAIGKLTTYIYIWCLDIIYVYVVSLFSTLKLPWGSDVINERRAMILRLQFMNKMAWDASGTKKRSKWKIRNKRGMKIHYRHTVTR